MSDDIAHIDEVLSIGKGVGLKVEREDVHEL